MAFQNLRIDAFELERVEWSQRPPDANHTRVSPTVHDIHSGVRTRGYYVGWAEALGFFCSLLRLCVCFLFPQIHHFYSLPPCEPYAAIIVIMFGRLLLPYGAGLEQKRVCRMVPGLQHSTTGCEIGKKVLPQGHTCSSITFSPVPVTGSIWVLGTGRNDPPPMPQTVLNVLNDVKNVQKMVDFCFA